MSNQAPHSPPSLRQSLITLACLQQESCEVVRELKPPLRIIFSFRNFPSTDLNPDPRLWILVCVYVCVCSVIFDSLDYSSPGFSVHGIFQARILVWITISYFRGSFPPRYLNCIYCIPHIGRQILYYCATWEVQILGCPYCIWSWAHLSAHCSGAYTYHSSPK